GFADSVKMLQVGLAVVIYNHPAAGVMSGGNHGNRLFGYVDPKLQAARFYRGEMLVDKLRRLMANIQINALAPQSFNFMVDSARHNVARGKFRTLIKAGHKAFAIR